MDVSGRFIMCVFNISLPKAGCLVKYDPVRLPHDIVQDRRHETSQTPAGHVVIAYGLPDQPGPAYALTTGVAWLDVAGYDRHVNDDYQQDTAEHIQTDHRQCSQANLTTTYMIYATVT